jgi:hypothetical protein
MPSPTGTRSTLAIAACAALCALPASASAKTYFANRLGDHPLDGCTKQDCTLREAIRGANHHAGPDTIVVRGGKTYQLVQTVQNDDKALTGDLDIRDTLTITHTGNQRAIVDANGIDRVFEVYFLNDPTATFRGLVIEGGDIGSGGGGLYNAGRAILVDCVVRGNHAAAQGAGVLNAGGPNDVLRLDRTVVRNNLTEGDGGGVWTNSKVRIVRSTVDRNQAGARAGGILVGGAGSNVQVRNSTVSRNTAGGIGGGIWNDVGELRMRNSTVASNRADGDGGGIHATEDANAFPPSFTVLNNVTIARNVSNNDGIGGERGGGIFLLGTGTGPFKLNNTIVARNTFHGIEADPQPNCYGDKPYISLGHNLRGSDDPGCAGFTAAGDIVRPLPKLAPLGDYGGPTQTIRLNSGSPAIGKADPGTAEQRDQRGRERDAHPDIGAFERGA